MHQLPRKYTIKVQLQYLLQKLLIRGQSNRLCNPKGLIRGEVSADPSTPAKAVTHTIEMPTPSATKADPNVLEMLAREIYQRLRQRLELERERHGFYSGRLPW